MKYIILIPLIISLTCLKGKQCLPVPTLSDEDWNTLLKLVEKSKNGEPVIRYYEPMAPLSFEPISFDVNDFKPSTKILENEKLKDTGLWQSVKTFFTNDINTLSRDIAENYNPIPTIVSAIDDIKRSDTWVDINSFFTKGYNRMIELSKNIIDDLDAKVEADLESKFDKHHNKFIV